jgi:hydrogenase/urease accessory protein HupE
MRRIALLALTLGFAETASAHLVSTRFGEFYSGLIHPVSTLLHLVPWIALGIFGGLLGSDVSKRVLIVFPLAVAVGALLATRLPQYEFVFALNAASLIVLGLLAAFALQLNVAAFLGLTIIVGLSHGYANGVADLSGGPLVLYILGVSVAAYLLISIATGLSHALTHRTPWGRTAVRAVGSWVVAIGLVFGAYSFLPGAA